MLQPMTATEWAVLKDRALRYAEFRSPEPPTPDEVSNLLAQLEIWQDMVRRLTEPPTRRRGKRR